MEGAAGWRGRSAKRGAGLGEIDGKVCGRSIEAWLGGAQGAGAARGPLAKLHRLNPKPPPVTPSPQRLQDALSGSAPLARLQERLRESNARFQAIRGCVPAALLLHVRPGPVDEEGWALLAANAAVASKLRQLQPRLEQSLRLQGWPATTIRVRVRAP